MIRKALPLIVAVVANACATAPDVHPADDTVPDRQVVRSLLELGRGEVDGIRLRGLSGLALEPGTDTLYAVSDFGAVFVFRLEIDEAGVVIGAQPQRAMYLRSADGRRLRFPYSDAEGLALVGAGGSARLLVSFEQRPRIALFDLEGRELQRYELPAGFDHAAAYADRNKTLESIGLDASDEWLTIAEGPLTGDRSGRRAIIDRNGLRAGYRPGPALASAPVAMAVDGATLLVLERAYAGPLEPLVISVRRATLPQRHGDDAQVEDLLVMSTADGWPLDNFEGMARLPSGDLLLVSDNNDSLLQRSLLLQVRLP